MRDDDLKAQQTYIKKWAYKKMEKLEKKLQKYARIYFGKPMGIMYVANGVKIVHQDGSESEIRVPEK